MSDRRLLLLAKHVIPVQYLCRRIFFLAGPIRGADGWQMKAAYMIWKKYPGSIVVDPTRWEYELKNTTSKSRQKAIQKYLSYSIGPRDDCRYPSQAPWESEHMKLASERGMLLFWFQKESKKNPRPKNEGVYAQDTRVETGIWIERLSHNPKMKVKFAGHWKIGKCGRETSGSFGGLNFIYYYLTKEKDRRKIYSGKVKHPNLVLAKSLKSFIHQAI